MFNVNHSLKSSPLLLSNCLKVKNLFYIALNNSIFSVPLFEAGCDQCDRTCFGNLPNYWQNHQMLSPTCEIIDYLDNIVFNY
jgi:hypothetical protein